MVLPADTAPGAALCTVMLSELVMMTGMTVE